MSPHRSPEPDPPAAIQQPVASSARLDELLKPFRTGLAEYSKKLEAKERQIAQLTQSLKSNQQQIVQLTKSLGAAVAKIEELQDAQREHDTLVARLSESEEITQERDALAARLHAVEQTRQQIMQTIARDLGTVVLTGTGPDSRSESSPVRSQAPPRAQLIVTDRAGRARPERQAFDLRPGAVVGRRTGCDVELDDTFMSGEHARLTVAEGRWWVADLDSTNGTFVNGQRIERPTPLSANDQVRFGRVYTRFSFADA